MSESTKAFERLVALRLSIRPLVWQCVRVLEGKFRLGIILGEAEVGGVGLSGEGFVLGAVVGTLQCFGEGFIAAPVGKGTEAAGDGGGIGGGVETEDFGLWEEARGKIGGGFGEEDAQ